ncbi:MAG: CopG family antitoxin [Myxococcota bacterium]
MKERPLQYFSDEYIERAKDLTPAQIVEFLDQFREVMNAGQPSKSKLISMKVPENLLNAFKTKAKLEGRPYQSVIKQLMKAWLQG